MKTAALLSLVLLGKQPVLASDRGGSCISNWRKSP